MKERLKKEIDKRLIKRIEKIKKKNLDIPEHKVLKAIGIYIVCFIISNISAGIGGLSFLVLGLLYIKNNILPVIRNLEVKAIKKYLSNNINFSETKDTKNKDKGLFEGLNKTKETAKKSISNFCMNNLSKFKSKFNLVKNNVSGKIDNNSYRMTSNKIIQDRVSLKEVQALRKSEDVKAKTKTK